LFSVWMISVSFLLSYSWVGGWSLSHLLGFGFTGFDWTFIIIATLDCLCWIAVISLSLISAITAGHTKRITTNAITLTAYV
jgi:hypothetical protein